MPCPGGRAARTGGWEAAARASSLAPASGVLGWLGSGVGAGADAEMLEIPLNLRYDFSVTVSTLFFASAGVSSYLLTSENSGMYGTPWGYQTYQPSPSTGQHSYLFSAANLSLGVETGLSNSLSLLIAPYMKIPTRGIGFGQVQMSSVGINFALKFAPVISRKRK